MQKVQVSNVYEQGTRNFLCSLQTGLTPLMEAASGGYVEVGRVLLDKGADVNATPVPSSRDTALTIAADKGHYRFVELLIQRFEEYSKSPLIYSRHTFVSPSSFTAMVDSAKQVLGFKIKFALLFFNSNSNRTN